MGFLGMSFTHWRLQAAVNKLSLWQGLWDIFSFNLEDIDSKNWSFKCFLLSLYLSEHDDLLNFEIADGDFTEETLNEDELLLSDEGKI